MFNSRSISLKNQYTWIQGTFYISYCVMIGFAAVYLQHKGFSNFQIGIITGSSAFLTLAVQPWITQLAESIRCLSLKRMMGFLMFFLGMVWAILTFAKLPTIGTAVLYLIIYTIISCIPALLNAMGMEYVNQGKYLDFGFSRGIGSFTYASSAALLGFCIECLSPDGCWISAGSGKCW